MGEKQVKMTVMQLPDQSQKVTWSHVEMQGNSKAHAWLLGGGAGSIILENDLLHLVK